MFDIGIVLSLGFLIAALSALKLSSAITEDGLKDNTIRVDPNSQVSPVPTDGQKVVGQGTQVGKVYRLQDGRLIYVVEPSSSPSRSPSASPSP